jgi:hypothetical protein
LGGSIVQRFKAMWRILLSLIFVGLSAPVAVACECPIGTHKENFRWAKAIFIGDAVSVGTSKLSNPKISDRPLYSITFKVEKMWKGAKKKEVSVLTDSCASMCCLVQFREGARYLVYVYEDSFVPSDCAWSAEIESQRAQENMKDLNSFWFRMKARLWRF